MRGGSARYVEALLEPFGGRVCGSARRCSAITRARPITCWSRRAAARPSAFDEVVLATHSDQALAMLADATDREREMLGAIPYQPNEAVLHTDARCCRAAGARGRAGTTTCSPSPRDRTTVTYHMNRLQSLRAEREFCVTLNRTEEIDPAQVIRTIPYAHPVFTAEGVARAAPLGEISGRNRTHFCGAYWGWGFHEDGVVSALRVAERVRGAAVSAVASEPLTVAPAVSTRARSATGAVEPRRRVHATGSSLAYIDLDELPAAARRPAARAAARARCASAAATTSGRPGARSATAVRDRGRAS